MTRPDDETPMPRSDDLHFSELLDRVCACAQWRLGDERASAIAPFLRRYYARVPIEDIEGKTPDALFGAAFAHWELAEQRAVGGSLVRVYNPTLEEHGWHSEHTVLEVVTDDMPFLVDSVIAEVNRQDMAVHLVVHPVLRVRRDQAGRLVSLLDADAPDDEGWVESFIHVEMTCQPAPALPAVAAGIGAVLADVRAVVGDWFAMRARLDEVTAELAAASAPRPAARDEASDFLRWLRENNFTFLGYRACAVSLTDGQCAARIEEGSGLGLFRDDHDDDFDEAGEATVPPAVRAFLDGDDCLSVTKSHRKATVHRPVFMDMITVKRLGPDGRAAGTHVFVGLFSASVYNRSARDVPVLRRKLARLLERSGFDPRSHDGRALANIIETYPRDELFQVNDDQLFETALGILRLQLRQRIALFVRRDDFDRLMSCLVFVPRDRYTTQLRLAIHRLLERAFEGRVVTHHTQVGDAPLARLHVIVRTTTGKVPEVDVRDLEAEIVAVSRSWADRLMDALLAAHGEADAVRLHRRYAAAFPLGYRERFNAEQAIADIAAIERSLAADDLELALYRPFAATHMNFRFKIYRPDQPIILSHVLPILEHLGLRVVDEIPHAVRVQGDGNGRRTVMIHDFGLETQNGAGIEIAHVADRFTEAFRAVWDGRVESDRLNALILAADLSARQVTILRAYEKYLRQAGIPFTQAYLERVLTTHPAIAGAIIRLFLTLFDPDGVGDPEQRAAPLRAGIADGLDRVTSAEDDRILRRFVNLVEATQRTNYFQTDEAGEPKPQIAIKLDSRRIEDLPLPRPMVEVFSYSPRVEAIHLRGGKVARGGIRWSDRREDFRTEILGLMKAQTVKNAVIVPVGAKGGFVAKRTAVASDRDAWLAEGIASYRAFIASLLDLTDNLVGGAVVPPPRVVRRDGDDPYLVVAADKGTATFSDIANGIAADYGFWLGDAFASGGSQGYDHKAMGITARGAWESVQRHFREIGRDTQAEDFTVVGVGDMSGDVFGNGMLLSPRIRLLAAFDHRHIFVDPDPDAAVSLAERQRLFTLPRSSWADYEPSALSAGGAIYPRQAKVLRLTPEIRARFEIAEEQLTPAELIRVLLKSPIDLLWFGGIGTFVKAAFESHGDAGDRANDSVRVDADQLRCKVIGEGANLGITQLGRVEFARAGGRLNTDFIDNSAGVDCSDHEVNIKILLDAIVAEGDLTEKQRNHLLVEMTGEVAGLVLRDNYLQTQAISLMQVDGFAGLEGQARLIHFLERQGRLNRAVEFLPDDDALTERAALRQGLTRPELAVLFSYCKIWLNDLVLASNLPDDPYLADDVARYFPQVLRERFPAQIARHRLGRELISTSIINSLINRMGGTFVADMGEKTGATPVDIARAYIIARDVFAARALWEAIEALDGVIAAAAQYALHREIQQLIERGTLWFLRNGGTPPDISANIGLYREPVGALAAGLEGLLPESIRERIRRAAATRIEEGVSEPLARSMGRLFLLPSLCDIVRIAARGGLAAEDVARAYFVAGDRLGFGWLRERAGGAPAAGHWQRLAISAVVEELYAHQRDVTEKVLAAPGPGADAADGAGAEGAYAAWSVGRQPIIDRSRALLIELEAAKELDISMLAVASRQLRALAES